MLQKYEHVHHITSYAQLAEPFPTPQNKQAFKKI